MRNRYLGNGTRSISTAKMEPKVLYKQSGLKKDFRTGEIRLLAVHFPNERQGVSVNCDAECKASNDPFTVAIGNTTVAEFTLPRFHRASPSRSCSCGFHAYKEYSNARYHMNRIEYDKSSFVLQVVASGKMFEYNKGYRYGHQRVEQVIVGKCDQTLCYHVADRLLVSSSGDITSLCRRCARTTNFTYYKSSQMSFSEFAEAASKSLPENAPRITIRSESESLVAWERGTATAPETSEKYRQASKWIRNVLGVLSLGLIPVIPALLGIGYVMLTGAPQ